jgi:CBS domain-containing protein
MRSLSDIVCNQSPLVMPRTATVKTACQRMRERRTGSVLVTDGDGALVGIFTGRDAVWTVLAGDLSPSATTLGEVMTRDPVTMTPEKTAIDALRLMWDGGFRHVPLVKEGQVCGCVSRGDFRGEEHLRLEEERELWEHMR